MTIPPWIDRKSDLLIDANLLAVLVIGRARESLLGKKPVDKFQLSDFERLAEFSGLFRRVLTTPHVLSEVNSLINKTGFARIECRAALGAQIRLMDEVVKSSNEMSNDPDFTQYGLTDISIKFAATKNTLVVTEDEGLLWLLAQSGIAALRYSDFIDANDQ